MQIKTRFAFDSEDLPNFLFLWSTGTPKILISLFLARMHKNIFGAKILTGKSLSSPSNTSVLISLKGALLSFRRKPHNKRRTE